VAVVLDDTLLRSENVDNNLDRDESLIVNTGKSEEYVRKEVPDFVGNIKTIDASAIAMDIFGRNYVNGIVLGKLIQVVEIASLESVKEQFAKIFKNKIGEELTRKNLIAIERGYDNL